MDLGKIDSIAACEKGKWFTITLPDGTPTDIEIKLIGVDAKAFKAQSLAIRKYVQSTKDKGKRVDDNVMDEKSFNMLAAATLDWKNMEENGEILKFSVANAKQIYESYPVIADQVASWVMDRSNFLEV